MIFKNELPMYLIEYELNKLFVTSEPTHMYLVIDWETIILIEDPNPANSSKTCAFPLPGFDEEFPFLAVCGEANISILNVKTCVQKQLVQQRMSVGYPGVQCAFMIEDENSVGMSLHFANSVIDRNGSGQDLVQYSRFDLKKDFLNWLQQNKRLPSTTMQEHFDDIRMLNLRNEKIQELEIENQKLIDYVEELEQLLQRKTGKISNARLTRLNESTLSTGNEILMTEPDHEDEEDGGLLG